MRAQLSLVGKIYIYLCTKICTNIFSDLGPYHGPSDSVVVDPDCTVKSPRQRSKFSAQALPQAKESDFSSLNVILRQDQNSRRSISPQ